MPEERKGIEGRFSDRIFCQKTDSPVEYLVRIDITADPVCSSHDGHHVGLSPEFHCLRGQIG